MPERSVRRMMFVHEIHHKRHSRRGPRTVVQLFDHSGIPITLDGPNAYRGRAEPFAGCADCESLADPRSQPHGRWFRASERLHVCGLARSGHGLQPVEV